MQSFDVVVVGGGTSGCVVAARLSEDPAVSVLLLEAGGDERRPDVEGPDAWESLLHSDADWDYETVVQPATGRVYPAPRGKVLGGSGSINCMTHLRGHRHDFDDWARMGADGWDYAGVLGYFKRSEDVPDGDPRFRGRGGPLRPAITNPLTSFGQAYIDGALACGHPRAGDFNGAEMLGVGQTESLVRDGRRESTATSYLRPAMSRPNLSVITGAQVLGLVLAGERCVGVRYAVDGTAESVSAGEVVLSAGAVGSPQLLLLSGIGPAAELAPLGIEVAADLPGVGKGLQDHILLAGIRYHPARPVVDRGLGEGITVLDRTPGNDRGPDLHLAAMSIDWYLPGQQPSPNAYTFGVGHMRPRSRGEIRLVSADPLTSPAIDPGYLRERYDLEQLIIGVQQVEEIVRTGVFSEWGGSCDTTAMLELDDAALERAVKDAVSTYSHLSCSARMGTDADAVVDPHLRVHGISGLRVADASVMPAVVSCNTNAAAVMIGEKAADLVRGLELRDDGSTHA